MPTVAQVHGMLLEEALLHLLRFSGYQPVNSPGTDPTLRQGNAGLEVKGRGENHQIDAIADFRVPQPFTNPARLLVEAKFKDVPVGIEVVRNAVGVLKDVSEYWVSGNAANSQPRYHYQYAILASSGFTAGAQRYAVAHDVYLIQFVSSGFFTPVLNAIAAVGRDAANEDRRRGLPLPMTLSALRGSVRQALEDGGHVADTLGFPGPLQDALRGVITAVRGIEFAVLAVALGRLPLVLTPRPGLNLEELADVTGVRIYWDDDGWYLKATTPEEPLLFSFDLPGKLFEEYAEQDELTPLRAVQMKQQALSQIDALVVRHGRARLLRFELDGDWIQRVEQRLRAAE